MAVVVSSLGVITTSLTSHCSTQYKCEYCASTGSFKSKRTQFCASFFWCKLDRSSYEARYELFLSMGGNFLGDFAAGTCECEHKNQATVNHLVIAGGFQTSGRRKRPRHVLHHRDQSVFMLQLLKRVMIRFLDLYPAFFCPRHLLDFSNLRVTSPRKPLDLLSRVEDTWHKVQDSQKIM